MKKKVVNKKSVKKEKTKRQEQKTLVAGRVKKEAAAEAGAVKKAGINTDRLQKWILMILVFVLYANSLTLDYALDDSIVITDNQFTKEGISGIPDIFSYDTFVGFFGTQKQLVAGGRYRPLSLALFALEYEIFGLNPFVGHLTNLLIYAFCCYLVFITLKILFRKYSGKPWYLSIPFVATALFIAHPLHTEAVTNIKGLDEIMSLLGSISVLYLSLKYIQNKKRILLLISGVIFLLGLLAKENTITFLAIVPLTLFFFTRAKLRDHMAVLLPMIVSAIIYMIVRYQALGFIFTEIKIAEILNDPFINSSHGEKYATVIYTWLLYIKLLFFPHPLTHDYYPMQVPYLTFSDFRVIISIIFFLFIIIYALRGLKNRSIVSYGILFFLITFSILSNLVFNIGTFMNERFMFVPLLGFTIIVAWFFNRRLLKWIKNPKLILGIFAIIMLLYSVKTISRNFAWKNDYTLFLTDVETSTNSVKVNTSAGGKLVEAAREEKDENKRKEMLEKAITHLQKALSLHKTYSAAWVLLGNAYTELKDWENARICYDNCLKTYTHQPEALARLQYNGQIAFNNGDYARSIKDYQVLLTHKPADPEYLFQIASNYAAMGRPDTSLIILNRVIEKNPGFYKAYRKTGEIYGQNYQNLDKSTEYLLKAYELNKTDVSLLENLGVAFGMKADYLRSIEFLEKALKLDSNNASIMFNLSKSYELIGNKQKADEYRNRALQARQADAGRNK